MKFEVVMELIEIEHHQKIQVFVKKEAENLCNGRSMKHMSGSGHYKLTFIYAHNIVYVNSIHRT